MRAAPVLFLILAAAAQAQEPVRLEERLEPGSAYHVSCRVEIAGALKLPDKSPTKALDIVGKSVIEYDERVLAMTPTGEIDKTLRLYSTIDFDRTVGAEKQPMSIRPAVRRMVMLRQNNVEVPFSPDGPMTWGEIDLVRTDVFTPALTTLLPRNAVRIGDTWKSGESAVRELTDLNTITAGELTCRLDKLDSAGGQSIAKITFTGAVSGIGENGPTKHELDGYLFFDRNARRIGYVSLKGVETLTDAKGEPQGKVTGTFVLTRESRPLPPSIAVAIESTPSEANTQMLFDDEATGLRFLHSRRWKARLEGNAVRLDDHRGNGVLLTVEPENRLPSALRFQRETKSAIEERKGTVNRVGDIESLQKMPTDIEAFTFDATIPDEKGTRRINLYHAIVRDGRAGVTVSATLTGANHWSCSARLRGCLRGCGSAGERRSTLERRVHQLVDRRVDFRGLRLRLLDRQPRRERSLVPDMRQPTVAFDVLPLLDQLIELVFLERLHGHEAEPLFRPVGASGAVDQVGDEEMPFQVRMHSVFRERELRILASPFEESRLHRSVNVADVPPLVLLLLEKPCGIGFKRLVVVRHFPRRQRIEDRRRQVNDADSRLDRLLVKSSDSILELVESPTVERLIDPVVHPVARDDHADVEFLEDAIEPFMQVRSRKLAPRVSLFREA